MGEEPSQSHAHSSPPVLRLRPTTEKKNVKLRKFPDGPWRRHPDEIEERVCTFSSLQFPLDINVDDYRLLQKERWEALLKEVRKVKTSERLHLIKIKHFFTIPRLVDMSAVQELTDDEIEVAIEEHFVHNDMYLAPGMDCPTSLIERFCRDWSWNARGIYYRHYYSPHWVTADCSLWLPTVDSSMFDDPTEQNRRARAKQFLWHAMDNERWNKSEYAWEADAWNDVFGQMRNDPALAADKREYYTRLPEVYPVSLTLTGKSKFVKRIPDGTFGLASFHPKHYQNAVASYDLDSARLQALMLHRDCGLISDPRCGETDLVFPFAVYEAKGWSGDPREARLQACAAGAVYLDMLDALCRRPGPSGKIDGAYQFPESRSAQVFALTSFGAYWHIMVGYRRPRLKREYADHPGMSDTVYLYQRVWSGRIVDERKAWELLSLVDQIHLWGVTTFRRYVIRHLKSWHENCRRVWARDADTMRFILGKDFLSSGKIVAFDLPDWTKDFSDDTRAILQQKADEYLITTCVKEQSGKPYVRCVIDRCGTDNFPGYALFSPEDHLRHWSNVHHQEVTDNMRSVVEEFHRLAALDVEKEFHASQRQVEKRRALEDDTNETEGKRVKRG